MKKIFLVLFFLLSYQLLNAQSGKWGFALECHLQNTSYKNSNDGSGITVHKSINNGPWVHFFGQNKNLYGVNKGKWAARYPTVQIQNLDQKIYKINIYTKLGQSGGGNEGGEWIPRDLLSTTDSRIEYEHRHFCDRHSDDKCANYGYDITRIYKTWFGYMDMYIFPMEIVITTAAPTNFLSKNEKVHFKAPSGYKPGVYKWVYSINKGSTWNHISTGTEQPLFSAADVFGSTLESINPGQNVWIALEYYIYKDKDYKKVIERSDPLIFVYMKDAPHIVKTETTSPQCNGGNDGSVRVYLNRILVAGERLQVDYGGTGNIEIKNINLDNQNSFIINSLPKMNDTIKLQGYYEVGSVSINTYSDGANHNRAFEITAPPALSYSTSGSTNISCFGGNDGQIVINSLGGTGTRTIRYSKDNGAYTSTTNHTISGLSAGTYKYYVTDDNACILKDAGGDTIFRTLTLSQPLKALNIISANSVDASGFGLGNGSISVKIDGGTPLPSGKYAIIWKEKITQTPISTVTNEVVAGVFQTVLNEVAKGTYVLEINDGKDCTLSAEYTVNQPERFTVSISNPNTIKCYGENTASLKAQASGGVAGNGYRYTWYKKRGADSTLISAFDSISQLYYGTYIVVAKDNSRIPNQAVTSFTVTHPYLLQTTVSINDAKCYGVNNGSISISVTGGVGAYKLFYKKNNESTYSQMAVNVPANTFLLNNLSAGDYNFRLQDANSCHANILGDKYATLTINEPDTALATTLKAKTEPSGFGLSNGNISFTVEGGTQNISNTLYNVSWKNSQGSLISPTNTIENGKFVTSVSGLPKGTYTLEVKDKNYGGIANSCYTVNTITLGEPPLLQANITQTATVDCNGFNTGALQVSASGGIPAYTYKWYKKEGAIYTDLNILSSTINNLLVGTYKVTVEDNSRIKNTRDVEFTITEPTLLTTSVTSQNISCYNGNNGSINISVNGGVGNYKLYYKKQEEITYQQMSPNASNIFNINSLSYGDYNVYIQDGNMCYAPINGADMATITLSQPEQLEINTVKIKHPTGNGRSDGYLQVAIKGGTPNAGSPNYTIEWRNESNTTIIHSHSVVSGVFKTDISNLPKGKYSITVKDNNYTGLNNGCYTSKEIELNEPEPLLVNLENPDTISCHGFNTAELIAHVTGGIVNPSVTANYLPYKYKWYKVSASADVLLPVTDSIAPALYAGNYKVIIEDYSDSVNTVTSSVFTISEPSLLVTNDTVRNISCFGGNDGFIYISVTGGRGGYRLFCKKDNGNDVEYPINNPDNTFYLRSLEAGVYTIYIKDVNNCYAKINGDDIHTFVVSQPALALTISDKSKIDVSGFGRSDGSIVVEIRGGTANNNGSYNVIWRNEAGQILSDSSAINSNKYYSYLLNQPAGKYYVEISDKNYSTAYPDANEACIVADSFTLNQADKLVVEIKEPYHISCHSMNDGQLVAHVKGGIPHTSTAFLPYEYKWYKEAGISYVLMPAETDSIIDQLTTGNYKVVVSDFSRVTNVADTVYFLVEPQLLQATATNAHINCGQTQDIEVYALGGTIPYTYGWNTGDSTKVITGVSPGKYMVYVTDIRGCQTTALSKITTPGDLDVEGKVSQPVCYKEANGSIELTVTGGAEPYSYAWSNGASTKDLTNITAGNYTVTVTEIGGCTYTTSFVLDEPGQLTIDLGGDRTLCNGQELVLDPILNDNVQIQWTSGNGFSSNKKTVKLSKEGTYIATITDNKGCSVSEQINITVTNTDISSEMVVSSQVFLNDTIILVNISKPEPDSIVWLFDNENITVVEKEKHYAKVKFTKLGLYSVGMRSYVGECYQEINKSIVVLAPDQPKENVALQSLIRSFIVYPNPNNAIFTMGVELDEIGVIRLRLVGLSGITHYDEKFSGQSKYSISYTNTSLSKGIYIVVLETASERMSQKIIVY